MKNGRKTGLNGTFGRNANGVRAIVILLTLSLTPLALRLIETQ
jgi:hypothetical protein